MVEASDARRNRRPVWATVDEQLFFDKDLD
jgi:hypothetical protein